MTRSGLSPSMFLACLMLLASSTGCHMLSNACHQLGALLAPDPLCEVCGGTPCVCPPPNEMVPPVVPGPAAPVITPQLDALQAQVNELATQSQLTRMELDRMRSELESRNQELIATRTQFHRVEQHVGQLQNQMADWNQQVHALEQTLREQDSQRNQAIEQLTEAMARIADQTEYATSRAVLEAVER